MAVGDAVNAVYSVSAGGAVTYQPAAGVEVLVTSIGLDGYIRAGLFNGATSVIALPEGGQNPNTKIFISNAVYLRLWSTSSTYSALGSFSGVQTKGSAVLIDGKLLKGEELERYREMQLKELEAQVGKASVEVMIEGKKVKQVLKRVEAHRGPLGDLIGFVCYWEPA